MSRHSPRLSLGMPVRNGERFIREAIDSLLSQTFGDFELIICDNASSDATEQICREHAQRDARVSYHRNNRNLGPADNYNLCYRLGRGEYFKWAAHDDVCLPTYLEKCVGVLDSDRSVVNCHSLTKLIDENGEWLWNYDFRTSTDAVEPHRRFGKLINVSHRRHAGYEVFGVWRRSVMQTVPEQGAYAHADRVFLVRMSLRGRFHEVPEYLFLARRHASQSMAKRQRSAVREMLSRFIGDGPLPPPDWWDSSLKDRLVFPDWKLLKEYHASIGDAPVRPLQRLGCELYLGLWVIKYWPKLARDVIFALEQMLLQHNERGSRSDMDEADQSESTAENLG